MIVLSSLKEKFMTYSLVECSIFYLFNLHGKFYYFNKTFTTAANNLFIIRQELNIKINLKAGKSLVVSGSNLGSTLGIKSATHPLKDRC